MAYVSRHAPSVCLPVGSAHGYSCRCKIHLCGENRFHRPNSHGGKAGRSSNGSASKPPAMPSPSGLSRSRQSPSGQRYNLFILKSRFPAAQIRSSAPQGFPTALWQGAKERAVAKILVAEARREREGFRDEGTQPGQPK